MKQYTYTCPTCKGQGIVSVEPRMVIIGGPDYYGPKDWIDYTFKLSVDIDNRGDDLDWKDFMIDQPKNKKYYLTYEKSDGSISITEMDVELVQRAPFEYKTPDEHMYRILSGKYKDEIWCAWAFCNSKEEAQSTAINMYDDVLERNLKKFLILLDLVKMDRLCRDINWRI